MSNYMARKHNKIDVCGSQTEQSLNVLIKFIVCSVSVCIFIYNWFNNFSNDNNVVTASAVLILSLYNVVICRKNWYLLIIFAWIAYCNYSICAVNYFGIVESGFYGSLSNSIAAVKGINILLLFITILTLLMPVKTNNNLGIVFIKDENLNTLIVIINILILAVIMILSLKFSGTNKILALYGYSLIFFPIAFYYCGNKKIWIILLSALLCLYFFMNIAKGARNTAITLATAYFLMLFSHKIKIVKSIPYIIIGFIIFTGVGVMRDDFSFNISNFYNAFSIFLERKFSNDTAYSAYYTSLIGLIVGDSVAFEEKVYLFKQFLISMISGGGVEDSSLAEYTRTYYVHSYGTIFPFYLEFYLGWFGTVISSIIVLISTKIINTMRNNSGGLKKGLAVFITCNVFRWYVYSPNGIIRGPMLFAIVYCIFYIIDMLTKKYPIKTK